MSTTEPLIHSHHTDVLPEDHPSAYKNVRCGRCQRMVHAANNECMTTWIEWAPHVLCGECAAPLIAEGVLRFGDFAAAANAAVEQGAAK